MLELDWYKKYDAFKRKEEWYLYAKQQEQLSIAEIAQHMHEHNTPFTAGTIEGLLKDFVQCVHEQLLNGNSVKIDNLAIFRLAVESNAFKSPGDVDPSTARIGVRAGIGEAEADDKMKPAVKSVKLTATATGKLMRKNITRKVKLGWTTEAEALMDEERRKAGGDKAKAAKGGKNSAAKNTKGAKKKL